MTQQKKMQHQGIIHVNRKHNTMRHHIIVNTTKKQNTHKQTQCPQQNLRNNNALSLQSIKIFKYFKTKKLTNQIREFCLDTTGVCRLTSMSSI